MDVTSYALGAELGVSLPLMPVVAAVSSAWRLASCRTPARPLPKVLHRFALKLHASRAGRQPVMGRHQGSALPTLAQLLRFLGLSLILLL